MVFVTSKTVETPGPFVKTKIAFRQTECWILDPLSAWFFLKITSKNGSMILKFYFEPIVISTELRFNSNELYGSLPRGITLRKIMVFWENGFGIYNRTTTPCAALLSSWSVLYVLQYGSNCDGIYNALLRSDALFKNSHISFQMTWCQTVTAYLVVSRCSWEGIEAKLWGCFTCLYKVSQSM